MKAGCNVLIFNCEDTLGRNWDLLGNIKKRIDKILIINALLKYLLGEFIGAFFIYWGNS